jgi:hypothetical protein
MEFKSSITMTCNVHVELFGPDGELKEERFGHNLVPTTGLTHIADQLGASPSESAMGYMAIGAGTTVTSAGTSTLESELARVALDSRTHSAAVVTYVATFAAAVGTGAVTESGILNAASNGILLARLTFAVINKGASDSMVITWTLTGADDGV